MPSKILSHNYFALALGLGLGLGLGLVRRQPAWAKPGLILANASFT
jgi:hypothetical protein